MSPGASPLPCVLCGASRWVPLAEPGPQSMTSDWRVVREPLARHACASCGLVRRWPHVPGTELFTAGYALYAHAPGSAREQTRQSAYASWIAAHAGDAPRRVLDVGCGNGSLLLALRDRWPSAGMAGCDPSAESVAHGAAHGLDLWQGTAADLRAHGAYDLVTSVNVIEHTADPLAFLRSLRDAIADGGRLVLVCPDGGRPGLELLFSDHLFSFAPPHLHALVARAGFAVEGAAVAPASLGAFQLVVARPHGKSDAVAVVPVVLPEGRGRYLQAWSQLDANLLTRVNEPVVCFGAGEAAGLLRAYAPRTWALVRACTMDGDVSGAFGGLPIVELDRVAAGETVLVGVRPQDQPSLALRLRARFPRVVTWYDLLENADGGW